MARLPDALPTAAPRGVRPSTAVVDGGDLGIGQLGAGLASAAKSYQEIDRIAATPLLEQLQTANEEAYEADAAAYTGDEAGFASDQIAKARDRAQRILNRDDLSHGVRNQLSELALGEVSRISGRAISHEAQVRSEPIRQAVAARDAAQINTGTTAFITNFSAEHQKLVDGYDGSQAGFAENLGKAFDTAAQPVLDAAPERLRPTLQNQLASMRLKAVTDAVTYETATAQGYLLKNAKDSADAQINTVVSSPLAYDTVVKTGLPTLAAGLPVALRAKALEEWTAKAALARVSGLIDADDNETALTELKDGRYDKILDPQVKQSLMAKAQAAERNHAPRSFDEAMQQDDLERAAQADIYSRATTGRSTGQVDLDHIVKVLGPAAGAKYAQDARAADQAFAVTGAVRDMPIDQLAAQAAANPPDPATPDYATKLVQWQTGRQAAGEEMKARQNAGAWAFQTGSNVKIKGPGAAGSANALDRGAALQAGWAATTQASGADRHQVGARYAGAMMGVQFAAGIPASGRQIVPQGEAEKLASAVINAAPEQKLGAMQALARVIDNLPVAFSLPDGSTAAPQSILARQLQAAHMSPVELSAILDFGPDSAKLGKFVAAQNNPTLAKPLDGSDGKILKSAVASSLGPFLTSVRPVPGAGALEQARIDRTVMIARGLIANQGLAPQIAAKQAAADVTSDYVFIDGWRMPKGEAGVEFNAPRVLGNTSSHPVTTGAQSARRGAGKVLGQLLADKGANLYTPDGPGRPEDRRRIFAAQVEANAHWVTQPDDSGLALMLPRPDGGWTPVMDKWGRAINARWDKLKDVDAARAPIPFGEPPTNVVRDQTGAPVPAASRASAYGALAGALEHQESRGKNAVSPKGALGVRQIMPDTAAPVAQRLFGQPLDRDRLLNDPAYNRKIGDAILTDALNRRGTGAGIGLALVEYNAGPGRLDGFTDKSGVYHQGWLKTIGDPRKGEISLTQFVERIPFPETRDYVKAILPAALARLQH